MHAILSLFRVEPQKARIGSLLSTSPWQLLQARNF